MQAIVNDFGVSRPNFLRYTLLFFAQPACTLVKQAKDWRGFPKILSARDGATKPYRDVLAGRFLESLSSPLTSQQNQAANSPESSSQTSGEDPTKRSKTEHSRHQTMWPAAGRPAKAEHAVRAV